MSVVHLSVVIPVYNERATIEEVLDSVHAVDINKEIVIVDDGSTDGTRDILKGLAEQCRRAQRDDVRIFFQERNCGKGAALRRGFNEARGEIIVIQDADLEYDPQNFHALIEPIERGKADVVYGSRFLGGPHRVLLFWHFVGNKFLTILSNMFTDLNLSDVWTCHKAFRREVLEQLVLQEDRFGFEQEITCKVARHGWRVFEIPISYYGRTYLEGKKITWKDGFRGLWCVLRYSSHAKQQRQSQDSAARSIRPVQPVSMQASDRSTTTQQD